MTKDFAVEYKGVASSSSSGSTISEAKRTLYEGIKNHEGVVGAGVGRNAIGDPAIVVMLKHPAVKADIPSRWMGFEVVCEVTGEITAGI